MDLSGLSTPLIPLPDDLIILPVTAPTPPSPSLGDNSPKVSLTPDVVTPVDLSRDSLMLFVCRPTPGVIRSFRKVFLVALAAWRLLGNRILRR